MSALELLQGFLTSSGVAAGAGAVQLLALAYVLKSLGQLQKLTSELHRWHDHPDAEHPGAMIWWGTALNEVEEHTKQLASSVRAISTSQGEHLEAIRDLKVLAVEQGRIVADLVEYSKRAIATREHLVG